MSDEPLLALTHGDAEAADLLRRNLAALAEDRRGTPLAGLLDDVLAGRRPAADLHADPDFAVVTREGLTAYREHLAALTPEERTALRREAEGLAPE
ncbi:MAG: hypothetical protein JWN84_2892 [Nocardioides sp.]|nr:hypothetical protein [Nocardioides sp.]